MTGLDADDRADEAYEAMLVALDKGGFGSADVVYAIGMLIAQAIKHNAVDKRVSTTMDAIRNVVELEIQRS